MDNKFNLFKFLKDTIKSDLLLPLFLIITYIGLLVLLKGTFPTSEELLNAFGSIYLKYGYEIILIAAFFETLILANLFLPGGIALALGALFARTGQTDLLWVVLIGSMGAIAGYTVDYFLGSLGFAQIIKKTAYSKVLETASQRVKRMGTNGLILGFIHANLGSFIAVSAGAINYPFRSFITVMVVSTFFFSTLWAIGVYALGDIFLTILRRYGFLLVIFVICGLMLSKYWDKKIEKVSKK